MMKNTNWIAWLFLFIVLSCKSGESEPIPETPDAPQEEIVALDVDIESFADNIKDKTTLIKTITKNEVEEISSGLSYAEVEYLDMQDKPMAMYILLANLTKDVSLVASAAANGKDLNAKETVRKQMTYVEDRGYDVLAALNADFWRVNANEQDNTPMGQAYGVIFMDGEMIKDVTRSASQYYFGGLKKDGSFLIGDKLALLRARADLKEALGGRYLLVNEGKDVSGQISNKDIAPRTSIGALDGYNVVFIVVDGRRSDHSQGLAMQDLGKIYEAIGVKTAINLDGGGSSTILLKDNEDGFAVRNRPSDNVERAVANSWTIVKNSF